MSDENQNKLSLMNRSNSHPDETVKPIVLKLKKGGKKRNKKEEASAPEGGSERKMKYTRGLRDIQKLDENMVSIARKASKAVSKGMDVYERERNQSARAKTDGAIEDFINNTAKAGSAALKEAADIPVDIAEAVNPISYRKRMRRSLRRASKFIRLWRI